MIAALALAAAIAGGASDHCAARLRGAAPTVAVTAATTVASGSGFAPPDTRAARVEVGFCRVEGTIEGDIGFELWLPLAPVWNGHLLTGGVGDQADTFNYRDLARGVARGYASASTDTDTDTDTGHKSSDPHWLLGGGNRAVNYAERANHLLAINAKALVAAYYGRPASRAIFVGCSTGGRQALTEAQRFPADYDGIVAGAPGVNTPAMSARRMWEMGQHSRTIGLLAQADWDRVAAGAVAACDRRDGLADGVIADPRRCDFDPASLRCRPGRIAAGCLSDAQLALVRRVYGPLTDENGRRIDDGLLPGTPISATPLPEPFTPGTHYLAVALFGDGVHHDPHWDARTFRVAEDLPAIDRVMKLHADDPYLDAFRRRGGKLLMYQGWADPLVEPRSTINYYEAVEHRIGAAATDASVRLFMAPGMRHCVGGAGADQFGGAGGDGTAIDPAHDMLAAVEAWLDGGPAPERLVAARIDAAAVASTRPLCAYPKAPTYRDGDPAARRASAAALRRAGSRRDFGEPIAMARIGADSLAHHRRVRRHRRVEQVHHLAAAHDNHRAVEAQAAAM